MVTSLLLLPFCIHAQNLVPNGDFEKHQHLLSWRSLKNLSYWKRANDCTPDYLQGTDSWKNLSIPAHSQNHYVGILISPAPDRTIYAEYIQVKLTQSLEKGKLYYLKLFVCLSKESSYALRHLDYSITHKKISDRSRKRIMPTPKFRPVSALNDSILSATHRWMELCAMYRAVGGERHLTIGLLNQRFDPAVDLKKTTKRNIHTSTEIAVYRNTYYFIDDISIIHIKDSQEYHRVIKKEMSLNKPPKTITEQLDGLTVGEKLILETVSFEANQWDIQPSSEPALKELFASMQKNPSLVVEISGHTDNVGDKEKNTFLSEWRANAVADYLVNMGISRDRFFVEGYGSSVPIESNDTEAGRDQNERIEVTVLSK